MNPNNSNRGVIRPYHALFVMLQRVLDVVIVVATLPMICIIYQINYGQPLQIATILGGTFTWIAMGVVDAYRGWRGATLWHEIRVLLFGWFLVISTLVMIAWLTGYSNQHSRDILLSWFFVVPLFLMASHTIQRLILNTMRRRGNNTRRIIIVGAGKLGVNLAERIQGSEWIGMKIIGFFDDDHSKIGHELNGIKVLGNVDATYAYVKNKNIDHVYFALPMQAEERMRNLFNQLHDTTASLYLIPDLFVFELLGAREHDIAGIPAFVLCETPFTGAFGLLKRLEDIILSSVILLIIWPVLLLIATAIKFTSSGPIIFKQYRYGLNGKRIKVYKFCTMHVCDNDDTVIRQATHDDTRITPLGSFLRKTSLDELPQFFNVLQGNMSVVGPRPHAVAHNEQYRKLIKGYMWRHKVKPGITGWAQINGWRGETETLNKMEKRVEFDLDYIRRWSILFDLKIVFLTIMKGFINKDA